MRLVFFGDSICVGQGVSIHKGWVTRIAAHVSRLGEEHGVEFVVVNASVNGSTTRQALERMPYEVQSHGVDILIVQFGMNDCNYWQTDQGIPRVSTKAFAANLEEIIDRGFRFGAQTVIVNTNHPTLRDTEVFPLTETTYEQSNQTYNAIIRDVAQSQEARVVLNDIERSIVAHVGGDRSRLAELVLADGLHLSEDGHNFYFDIIAPVVTESVESAIRTKGETA